MDVYPDVLFAADVLRPHGLLARTLRSWMARRVRRADAVVVLGRAMRRPALAHGLPRARLHVIENWAPRDVEAQAGSELARAPDAPLTLLYSGNLGRAHDLTGLARAVRALPADAPLRLVVQAGGSGVARAKALFEDAPVPVEWRDPVALHDLAASLRAADLHVVSVRDGFERLVVPSKVYGPLALGLPLLVLGSCRCEPARIVKARGCGHVWSSDAEARDGLLRLVREGRGGLRRVEPLRRRALGISAWRALLEDLGAGARGSRSA
jgi:colanic acid biosynthesis glycosyl transferase WcaI